MSCNMLELVSGADFIRTITITTPAGTPVNLTGKTVKFTAKTDYNLADAEAVLSQDVTVHTNPTLGITTITILWADTTGIAEGEYMRDIKIEWGGNIDYLKRGTMKIYNPITQR